MWYPLRFLWDFHYESFKFCYLCLLFHEFAPLFIDVSFYLSCLFPYVSCLSLFFFQKSYVRSMILESTTLSWCSALSWCTCIQLTGDTSADWAWHESNKNLDGESRCRPFFWGCLLRPVCYLGHALLQFPALGCSSCQKSRLTDQLAALSWAHVAPAASFCTWAVSLCRFGVSSTYAAVFSPDHTIRSPSLHTVCFWSFIWGHYP